MTSWQNIDMFDHEIDRVTSMTDEQLDVRYTKMTKPEKIEAFHRALVQENRNPSLQQRISKDHGLSTITSWVLVHHPDGDPRNADNWTFRIHDENNIQVFHNDDAWQDKYANGYYSVAQARTLWDQLVAKGAKRWMK
jgi:hypothetical protein